MNPLVSVIIPVYNVESYLPRCVDSVLSQTYTDLEIILVNDGSTDNSPAICDDFAARDNRVTAVHQKNAGLGAARNAGLGIFKGEWVCFTDSDDWLESHFIETLLRTARDNDCLMSTCKMRPVFEQMTPYKSDCEKPVNKVKTFDARGYLMYINSSHYNEKSAGYSPWTTCISLFNEAIVKTNRFSNHSHGEDIASIHLFVYECEKRGSLIAVTDLCLYNYFQRSQSISRGKNINENWFCIPDAFKTALDFYKSRGEVELHDIYWRYYYDYCVKIACEAIRDIPQYKHEIESVVDEVRRGKNNALSLSCEVFDSLSAVGKFNRDRLMNKSENLRFVMYGYGRNGRLMYEWLRFFGVPITEIWDSSAGDCRCVGGVGRIGTVPLRKMHGELKNGDCGDIMILCTIKDHAVYRPVLYELRLAGYEKVMTYEALDAAIKYESISRLLPFLMEDWT
ncbi:MAG: glycosyltransferase family 2 protein [Oscillospiraceae bacterium]|nr:glycosyltransferase family 2 protein [Oscillospiraceae bacterium]